MCNKKDIKISFDLTNGQEPLEEKVEKGVTISELPDDFQKVTAQVNGEVVIVTKHEDGVQATKVGSTRDDRIIGIGETPEEAVNKLTANGFYVPEDTSFREA